MITEPSKQQVLDFTKKFRVILQMQDDMNKVVNPDWVNAKYKWSDAAMMEAAEAFDMTPWPWWKKASVPNWTQIKLELVDIFHFALSQLIERSGGTVQQFPDPVLNAITMDWLFEYVGMAIHLYNDAEAVELLQTNLRSYLSRIADNPEFLSSRVGLKQLFTMMALTGMTPDDCAKIYLGKNVLNKFRQGHGYKAGTYVKIWDGHEDNVWLERFMSEATCSVEELPEYLTRRLATMYAQVTTPKTT